jgi:hypothetical protein
LRRDPAAGRAELLEAAVLCPALADAAGPLALADLLHDSAVGEQRDAAIARCRSLGAALRGNASSWLFTWYDPAGTMHAFTYARSDDIELALDRFERIADGAPPADRRHDVAPRF